MLLTAPQNVSSFLLRVVLAVLTRQYLFELGEYFSFHAIRRKDRQTENTFLKRFLVCFVLAFGFECFEKNSQRWKYALQSASPSQRVISLNLA